MARRFGTRSLPAFVLRMILAVALAGGAAPLAAQPAPLDSDPLGTAREYLKNAEYDQAISLLKESIEETQARIQGGTARLRELYLLLIKTYVVRSNASRFEPQGLETSRLYLEAARRTTEECLRIHTLRDTRPDPGGDYPPEMFALFNEVTAEIFGSLRITKVTPPEATVIFDGDTLRAEPDGVTAAGNIPAGSGHLLVIRADGYRDLTEELTISPNSTLERPYALKKNKGFVWYASRGAVLAGGAVAVALLAGGSSDTPPEPLPGPPAPPGKGDAGRGPR